MAEQKIKDEEYIATWQAMLRVFKEVDEKASDAVDQYKAIIEEAKNTITLTPRQREGVVDRCKWQIFYIEHPEKAKKGILLSDYDISRQSKGVKNDKK